MTRGNLKTASNKSTSRGHETRTNGQPRSTEKVRLRPHGLSIALLGPDGCGKSTIAELLRKRVEITRYTGAEIYHGHFGFLPELKVLKKLLPLHHGGEIEKKPLPGTENIGMDEPHSIVRSFVYIVYYSIDFALSRFSVGKAVSSGKLVIFDRWFHDFFFQRKHRRVPRWLLWLIAWPLPKPDLTVFLFADPHVIRNRKPELTVEEISRELSILSRLREGFNGAVSLRTDRPAHETVEELEGIIRKRLWQGKEMQ